MKVLSKEDLRTRRINKSLGDIVGKIEIAAKSESKDSGILLKELKHIRLVLIELLKEDPPEPPNITVEAPNVEVTVEAPNGWDVDAEKKDGKWKMKFRRIDV